MEYNIILKLLKLNSDILKCAAIQLLFNFIELLFISFCAIWFFWLLYRRIIQFFSGGPCSPTNNFACSLSSTIFFTLFFSDFLRCRSKVTSFSYVCFFLLPIVNLLISHFAPLNILSIFIHTTPPRS